MKIRNRRLERAIRLYREGHVYPKRDGFAVLSSDDRRFYRASLNACECLDQHYRPHLICKHRLAIALAERRLSELMRGCGTER